MRVIAGRARSLKLQTVEGMDTRPTTDRIKETLFNMLSYDIADAKFLDLFAGSGAIGIEALSRGASQVHFVEKSKKAVRCIEENLKFTKLTEGAFVHACDVLEGIRKLKKEKIVFDIVFMDPPYQMGIEEEVLKALADSGLIDENTLMICEADLHTDLSFVHTLGLDMQKEKKYKTNKHVFIKKR